MIFVICVKWFNMNSRNTETIRIFITNTHYLVTVVSHGADPANDWDGNRIDLYEDLDAIASDGWECIAPGLSRSDAAGFDIAHAE